MNRIGIQGGEASYTEMAAKSLHPEAQIEYFERFKDVFKALRDQVIDSAVVAFANNRVGFIPEPYIEIAQYDTDLSIVKETYVPVQHALLGVNGATIADIEEVHSQRPAIQQCSKFLDEYLPKAHIVEERDTAGSAQEVARIGDKTKAAIASTAAGDLYGLEPIYTGVQDDETNITRFVEVQLHGIAEADPKATRTSLVIVLGNDTSGVLHNITRPFAEHGVNMYNAVSRTVPNTDFDIDFFIECAAPVDSREMDQIIGDIEKQGHKVRVLGSYGSSRL